MREGFAAFLSLVALAVPPSASAAFRLEGRVLERGTRNPLESVNVFLLPSKRKAVTDAKGVFVFEAAEEGEFQIIVNLPGYERLERPDRQDPGAPVLPRTLYVEKSSYRVYETTVFGKQNKDQIFSRSLGVKEAIELPGSNNDPIRAVQNLPGVARSAGFSSQVVIQGSAPQDTSYLIEGHEVPLIFHFGGLSSVVMPEALDRVDYLSAGYGPDYGRATGGLVSVWTRKPRRDRLHGFGYLDLFNAGAAFETPVGEKGSLFLGARKSYIGEVLKAVSGDDEDFALTAAPSYQDLTLVYDRELTPKDEFRFTGVISRDELEFVLKKPLETDPSIQGDFYNRTSFYRLIPQWTHRHGARTLSRHSLALGQDYIKFVLGSDFFDLVSQDLTVRSSVEHSWSEKWKTILGMDHRFAWADVKLSLPDFSNPGGVGNPVGTGARRRVDVDASIADLGLYLKQELSVDSRWTVRQGLRVDYFSSIDRAYLEPRIAVRRELTPYRFIRAATGLYAQPPSEQESDETVGNPELRAPKARHLALAWDEDFRRGSSQGFELTTGPFLKWLDDLVTPSSDQVVRNGVVQNENFENGADGKAFGWELLLKYREGPWNGWLSWTVSRSTRREDGGANQLSEFDQTQNINLIAARDLPKNWRVSTRFRFITGNPITPVTGSVFDADNDVYVPIRGPFFSERVRPFLQWDVRVDRRWIYDRWILSAYLDIQNALNRKNVENVSYAYDYSTRQDAMGLPILPTIGLRGEF